jgi:DNA repair protein RecO (recombination protein O)
MDERASGIILRIRPLTETSLIVEWLSLEHGRLSTVAKGARRPKSPFVGKLDLFYEAEFSFQRSRRSELHTLREISLLETRSKLRESLSSLHAAAYFSILIEQGLERETPVPEFYGLFRQALNDLAQGEADWVRVFAFELNYLDLLGLAPDLSPLSEKGRKFGEALSPGHFEPAFPVSHGGPEAQELSRFLRTAIGTALEKLPPQRERALRSMRVG